MKTCWEHWTQMRPQISKAFMSYISSKKYLLWSKGNQLQEQSNTKPAKKSKNTDRSESHSSLNIGSFLTFS